jgi:diaminohydroxyphosphoribosylaminopyrimidine deaminase/5-amino-6-(5-phosphoribosylamino)uracil reductase
MVWDISKKGLEKYMLRCIELAKNGKGVVGKPFVGAVVVNKKGDIIGEGYKTKVDKTSYVMHAERMALNQAGPKANGSYLITTLEPCIRVKKTQIFDSCCDLIVQRGIETVVIGIYDESPSVNSGKGVNYLSCRNINIKRCKNLNQVIIDELMPKTCVIDCSQNLTIKLFNNLTSIQPDTQ